MDPNIFIKSVQFLGAQGNKGAIQIDYIQRIINNNRVNVTEEERRNPVIFDKPCKNFIEAEISIVTGRDSAKWLSGGNFDFKTNSGSGYILRLRYPENDAPVKEAGLSSAAWVLHATPEARARLAFWQGRNLATTEKPDC